MTDITTDANGFPLLLTDEPSRTKPRRTELGVPGARMKLYDDDGRPLGPTESLDLLLNDGGIAESEFNALALQFDDPNIIPHAAERLGAIRVRRADGSIYVELPTVPNEPNGTDDNPPEPKESISMSFSDDLVLDSELVPFKEATRRGISIGQIHVHRRGGKSFVKRSDLEKIVGSLTPKQGGEGAGSRIARKIGDATKQRSQAHEDAVVRRAQEARRKSSESRRAATATRRGQRLDGR